MVEDYNIKQIFGYNLRNLRESKNLTQQQLADYLGLETYQTINRIENGKSFITSDLFEKICKLFKIEPYMLLLKPKQIFTKDSLDQISEINNKLNEIHQIITTKFKTN